MELPNVVTVQHQKYGAQTPEELGVGCARHWLVRLAASLKLDYAFFLDDSVRSWRGITLVDDAQCQFGHPSGSKAHCKIIPMARVMDYLVAPEFYKEEGYPDSYDTQTSSRMQSKLFEGARQDGFGLFGFARLAPELLLARTAFSRSHVYSAFLLNISKVLKEGLNYKQELFVWEDIFFNLQVHDVVKTNRFAMVKQPYKTGGCSEMARAVNRLSAEELAAEVMGEAPQLDEGKKKRGRPSGGSKRKLPPEVEESGQVFDLFKLEEELLQIRKLRTSASFVGGFEVVWV
eukprot:g18640.t1